MYNKVACNLLLRLGPTMRLVRFSCLRYFLLSAFLICAHLGSSQAQDAKPQTKRTVIDALREVDSQSEREMEWVTAFLEERVAENEKDSLANCVLAMVQFRTRDFKIALKSFERANSGNNVRDTRSTNGKFQLLCAINTEDGAESTRLFLALLNACQRETTPMEVRKSYCEWMGEIIGTLDTAESKPPIDQELLIKAKKSLLGLSEKNLSQAFENQYSNSHLRAQTIVKILAQYEDLGEAGMQEMEQTMSAELENLEKIRMAAVKETKEASSENQSATKSLRQEMASLKEQIRRRDVERASVGPGMPAPIFPPGNPPILPNRDAIYVNPFFIRYVTEIINNQRVTREVQERRDYRDIESERAAIYQEQMNIYNAQFTNYKVQVALFSQYQKNLAEWNRREVDRRKSLLDERNGLEDRIAQLRLKLDEIEATNKENAGGNADLRKSIDKLKKELANVRLVLDAAKLGKPHLAIRPTKIDPWLFTEEKNRLLKVFSDK